MIGDQFSWKLISEIKFEINSIFQVDVYKNMIFLSTDFYRAGEEKIIQCRDLITGEILNEFNPQRI